MNGSQGSIASIIHHCSRKVPGQANAQTFLARLTDPVRSTSAWGSSRRSSIPACCIARHKDEQEAGTGQQRAKHTVKGAGPTAHIHQPAEYSDILAHLTCLVCDLMYFVWTPSSKRLMPWSLVTGSRLIVGAWCLESGLCCLVSVSIRSEIMNLVSTIWHMASNRQMMAFPFQDMTQG